MSVLLHGDCLDEMKGLDDNSVDLIFCDLPYGQTSCKWDCCIDLEKFWVEIMRIKKTNTPLFFTTTTKFGVSLIQSAPKQCPFRYDIVWVKSASAGFLTAKKMPLRRHEMIYVFYEKLPFYDLSSHKHKFIEEGGKGMIEGNKVYECKKVLYRNESGKYDPPLPVSVVKEESSTLYNNKGKSTTPLTKHGVVGETTGQPRYDPPLPVSVVNDEETYKGIYSTLPKTGSGKDAHSSQYEPPLPNSMLEIKSTRGKHSTEKPVALMEWILKYYSKEGDVVLDPTMGSGSTGIACKNMNRNFIGIEKDDEIYEVACNRIYD
tara:strand:- start:393 stop:1346 length:954 start_codon:yes stop_codon:yes gene_type:complete